MSQASSARDSSNQVVGNNLCRDFYRYACADQERPALFVDDQIWSYAELAEKVSLLAGWFRSRFPQGGANIGILANRSAEAYIGLLAALWSGNAYVPLSTRLPAPYLLDLMQLAQTEYLVVDKKNVVRLDSQCFDTISDLTLVSPLEPLTARTGRRIINPEQIKSCSPCPQPSAVKPDATAYIMFTSGSTGTPKGIAPTVANVRWFLEATQQRYHLAETDRLSQFNDLPWDPSVFDLFSAWKVGAASYVVPERQLFAPSHFIRQHSLTVWYSGPVQIRQMQRMRQLAPGSFPTLRLSLFVGEPLLADMAGVWQAAACNSLVENVYGPTETTVVCLGQPFSEDPSCRTPERDYLALGTPYQEADITIIDERGHCCRDGQVGEIAISGPMVTPGYWRDPERSKENFVTLPGRSNRSYLTGDLGYRATNGVFHFMGRKDNQMQIHGVRIEPEEIEHHLRGISEISEAAVIGWPEAQGLVTGLTAFVSPETVESKQVKRELAAKLPGHMVPAKILSMASLPRNRNHKIDRSALKEILRDQQEMP